MGKRYTLLLDGGILKGWGSKDSWLLIVCHDENVEQHLLGSGGNQNLRPSCRRPPTRTFHTPVGTLRLDAPALV